jgi:c-di-GMP-binding flagellar brake protein YcgR
MDPGSGVCRSGNENGMKGKTDRRKQTRRQVNQTIAASLDPVRSGIITDISHGGMAFRYIASPYEIARPSNETGTISIAHDDFVLTDIPCRVVNDRYLLQEYSAISTLKMFKCSIQFEDLPRNQQTHLDYFLTNFTEGA